MPKQIFLGSILVMTNAQWLHDNTCWLWPLYLISHHLSYHFPQSLSLAATIFSFPQSHVHRARPCPSVLSVCMRSLSLQMHPQKSLFAASLNPGLRLLSSSAMTLYHALVYIALASCYSVKAKCQVLISVINCFNSTVLWLLLIFNYICKILHSKKKIINVLLPCHMFRFYLRSMGKKLHIPMQLEIIIELWWSHNPTIYAMELHKMSHKDFKETFTALLLLLVTF